MRRDSLRLVSCSLLLLAFAGGALAQQVERREGRRAAESPETSNSAAALPASWIEGLRWRSIGPANMGGRITAFAVSRQDPSRWWAATASGGLLRTVNNGITFEHQFDREATVSIGDVAVAPSDHDIVWVGTGESNPRNSVSWGNGVYKSVDGGKTWKHMGLDRSFQVGRIAIHPENPDIVYVGALGRLWGPNEERGLYKTVDGGKTWERVLFVDDETGVIDVQMHPRDPETLLVATYERQRDEFCTNDPAKKWGDGSGLHKTTDGGRTWRKITEGLPTGRLGRIGIDYWQKNPDVIYMVLESEHIGKLPSQAGWMGVRAEDVEAAARITRLTEGGPAARAGLKAGDIVVGLDDDRVYSADDLLAACRQREAGAEVVVEVLRDRTTTHLKVTLEKEPPPRQQGRGGDRGERERTAPRENEPGEAARRAAAGGGGERTEGGERTGAEAAARPQPAEDPPSATKALPAEQKPAEVVATPPGEAPPPASGEKRPAEAEARPATEPAAAEERPATLPERRPPAARTSERGESGRRAESEEDAEYRPFLDRLGGQDANLQDHQAFDSRLYGGLYRSEDGGETWTRINSLNPRPMYFSQVRVDPQDDQHVWILGISLHRSKDGGQTFTSDGGRGTHADHHAMWIDPRDGRHVILGNDGGMYVTYDRGENWDHLNHVAIGQFYHVDVDPRRSYRVYGGLQDNGSWGGPSRVPHGRGPVNEDWFRIGGGDGFVCRVDPDDPDQIYFESQNGGMGRRHLESGERGGIRPEAPRGTRYRFNWNTPFILSAHNTRIYYVAGNHVFRSLDRGRALQRISPEISRTDRGSATALAESPVDPNLLFVGTDDGALWRTKDGGREWTKLLVLPDAGTTPVAANGGAADGTHGPSVTPASAATDGAVDGNDEAATAFVDRLLERDANGDGKLQREELSERMAGMFERADADRSGDLDRDELRSLPRRSGRRGARSDGERTRREARTRDGAPEASVAAGAPAPLGRLVPGPRYVSAIVPSRFEKDRIFLALDGHRSDDDAPFLFLSEDCGDTWRSIVANLPATAGSMRTIVEDIVNPDVLYAGSEFAAWVSVDRGASWTKLNGNLPTVAVHAFAQHPSSGEIVAATHGRSLWVLDVSPIRQITPEVRTAPAWLFRPSPAIIWKSEPSRGGTNRSFVGENPPDGAVIHYALRRPAREIALEIRDRDGMVLRNLEARGDPGLHAVTWDLRREPRLPARTGEDEDNQGRGGRGFGGRGRFGRRGSRVAPGVYQVVLYVDGQKLTQDVRIEADPDHAPGPWLEASFEEEVTEGEPEEREPLR